MRDYAQADIKESADGDLLISNGDLSAVNSKNLENLAQYIKTILSTPYDNLLFEDLGIDLSIFIGEANTPETAADIILNIKDAISYDGYITKSTIEAEAVPISKEELSIQITAKTINTQTGQIESVHFFVVYDYLSGRIQTLRG